MPAFADVEDDAAREDGMDYTGQPASPWKRYYLYVPGVTYNVMTKTRSVWDNIPGELDHSEAARSKKVETHGTRHCNDDVCQRYNLSSVSMENV